MIQYVIYIDNILCSSPEAGVEFCEEKKKLERA
jgi:hypothetical protein